VIVIRNPRRKRFFCTSFKQRASNEKMFTM